MKKVLLVSLLFVTVLSFSSIATAKKPTRFTCAPTELTVINDNLGEVCFDWEWLCDEGDPVKYSVDVELLVAGEGWDDPLADIQQLSFGTSNRTDGEAIDETSLCVPIEGFVYWDGENGYQSFTGDASAKVKALAPSRDFKQNNPFSDNEDFEL